MNFGDVSVADVSNQINRRKVIIPVTCGYAQGTAYVKVTGNPLEGNENVLMTNINNFGIALYQGDGTTHKLILGEGKGNGNDTIGYPIESGLSGKIVQPLPLRPYPIKKGIQS